jgi:flagellar hook-basal body complex protein FliE
MNPINNLSTPPPIPLPGGPSGAAPAAAEGPSFRQFLLDSIHEVNAMQQEAEGAVEQLVTGGDVSMVEVLSAVQKADVAFRLMIQVRNKLVQAYQEIQDIRV